jgi:flagellar basal body rod protein FlgG
LGVITGGAITNYTAGALKQTDQPFDMALAGDGFFAVQTPDGERYTRDGRFTRDANNHLVTVDGNLLLGSNNQPITVPQGVTTGIASDGKVTVDNQAAGQIKLVTFANLKTDILRDGPNTFSAVNPGTVATNASLKQGFLESSNVDPAKAMTQMMTVSRAYEAAQRLMQMQDEMLGKAVNEVGQV